MMRLRTALALSAALIGAPLCGIATANAQSGYAPGGYAYAQGGRGYLETRYETQRQQVRPASRRYAANTYASNGDIGSMSDEDNAPYGGIFGSPVTHQGVAPQFRRQIVSYPGREAPGSIVISTANRYLYLVQGNGTAIRYGIGVGRQGFQWRGTQRVSMKREWPGWTPPAQMRKRRPDLPAYMEGGPNNPLGARALYLGSSLYRIHGTNEPNTIGQSVSSGCIRLTNEDVQDLYSRVRVGARVQVM